MRRWPSRCSATALAARWARWRPSSAEWTAWSSPGGIGEHSAVIRREICRGLEHLGVALHPEANEAGAPIVSPPGTACVVRVVKTNEDLVVARHTRDVLHGRAAGTDDRRQQCKSA